jgi:type II secretory pathway component PulC
MPRPAIARTPAFVLSGIVFSKEDSYAIVNDQVLRVGDQIRGAKLMAVAPDSITLDVQGQPVVIQAAE